MDDTTDRTLDAVGPRLKQLRQRRDVTLSDLAEQTGISISTLSRLEAGLRRPTLEQLLPLARTYGATLDELVDAPPTGDPRINLRPIPTGDGRTIIPLTRRAGGIQAYKFILPAGRDDAEPELRTHEGYDWAFVLNGHLRLVIGEHDLILEPGEAAEFDTRPRTGSAPPVLGLLSSSASWVSKVNVPTSARPPAGTSALSGNTVQLVRTL